MWTSTATTAPPSRGTLLDCVRVATAAPSVHNSQPWRFRLRSGVVDVYADPDRRLPVLDPSGRAQLISVGAAVFTLRLAIRRAGYGSDFILFPEPSEPGLAARVIATHGAANTPTVEALAAAVLDRHTNRWPFAPAPVPAEILDELRDAARGEGAVLGVPNAAARDTILKLARAADRCLRDRPGYRDELARWGARGRRDDGVPAGAAGPRDAIGAIPLRDFTAEPPAPRHAIFEPDPTILVLATAGDRRPDWIRAGQALQRVLLTATSKNLATMPISQPVEVPAVRRLLLDPAAGLSVQMVLRIGYGRPAATTPRRPLAETLLPPGPPAVAVRSTWG